MRKLLSRIFGKRKDGKCQWWEHDWDKEIHKSWMRDTNNYIDGKPIQKKEYYLERTCKTCGLIEENHPNGLGRFTR